MKEDDIRFSFGKNWQSFVDTKLDTARIDKSVDSLQTMLQTDTLRGRTFLDVGCGSGLFSLAACLLGAERVVAFDYDADSVQASLEVRTQAMISKERWEILRGSILDDAFMSSIDSADVVYSWGVLHHTGEMWKAIKNAASKVQPDGLFAVAIYNDRKGPLGSVTWWHIKRIYNRSPKIFKRLLESAYATALIGNDTLAHRDPLRTIRSYEGGDMRGMDFWHDVRDWLGGFPYEYATTEQIIDYMQKTLGWQLEYLNSSSGCGCNEFTFRYPELL